MGGFSVSFFQDCIDIETIPCYGLLLSTQKHLFIHSFFIWLHYGGGLYGYTPFNIIYYMYLLYSLFFFSQQVNHKVRCNSSNVIKKVQNLSQNQTIYIANIGFKSALGKWYIILQIKPRCNFDWLSIPYITEATIHSFIDWGYNLTCAAQFMQDICFCTTRLVV